MRTKSGVALSLWGRVTHCSLSSINESKEKIDKHMLSTFLGYFLLSWKNNHAGSVMSESFVTPTDCSLSGSSVHGISQARILDWVAVSSSRGSLQPRDQPILPALANRFFTVVPPGKPNSLKSYKLKISWKYSKIYLFPNP